jgi:L-cystine transport system substrate-binding protein
MAGKRSVIMKKLFKKSLGTAAFILAGFVLLAFAFPAKANAGGREQAAQKVIKVPVAVANDFIPYAYLYEKDNYIGYEVELLREVDKLLPQYEFEYETVADQWVALTAGRVDLITHQWESNPKRLETYLFGREMITSWESYLAFKPGRTDLNRASDMEGKIIQVGQGSGAAYFVETYNAQHGNKIKVVYSTGGTEITLSKLETGAIDAYLGAKRNLEVTEKNYNVTLGKSAEPVYNVYTYFVFRKDNPDQLALRNATDEALKTLRVNGTMSRLSHEWLGGEYTKWGPEHGEN